jgi:hypothetical protein
MDGMDREEIDRRAGEQLDREERASLAEQLEAPSARDTSLAIGSAVAQLVPGLGAAIATLIGEYIPRRRQERMVEFVRELDRALADVQERAEHAILTDTAADVVEEVLERVIRATADGKRAYYAAAVANTLVAPDITADERARMMDALDRLRPSNLRLLALVVENPPPPDDFGITAGGIYEYLSVVLPGIPQEQMRLDWSDLAAENILDGYPSGTMTREGLINTRGHLQPFGHRFVAWITPPTS